MSRSGPVSLVRSRLFGEGRCACIFLGLAFASLGLARAQVVTWAEVIRSAQLSHPVVLGKVAAQAGAVAEWEAANWQRFPTPSVEAGSLGGQGTQTLRLDQPIWTAGRIDASIVAAEWRGAAAKASVDEARREVTAKALSAVSEAARQSQRERVAARALEEHERLLALIQRRVSQEVSPASDEVLARARLATARTDLSLARQGVRQAMFQVSQLLGRKATQIDESDYEQTMSRLAEPQSSPGTSDKESTSPLLRRLSAEVDVAVAESEEKRAQQWPQLLLRLERVHGALSDTRAGLILSYLPGAGFSAQAGLEVALAKRDAAREALAAAKRELQQQIDQTWDEWRSAKERLAMATQTQTNTAEVLASYTRQYVVGRKSWMDVMNALRESGQAELVWVDIQHQVWTAQTRWHGLMGAWDELYRSASVVESVPSVARTLRVQ